MASLNTAKVIRRVRHRLKVSQEGLSRLLNATKGAVQHWERGRNRPDLARLMALRRICPPGPERKELDVLVRQAQSLVPPGGKERGIAGLGNRKMLARLAPYPPESLMLLRRDNHRLERQVDRLQATLDRRSEQLRILQDVAADLQRQVAELRAGQAPKSDSAPR